MYNLADDYPVEEREVYLASEDGEELSPAEGSLKIRENMDFLRKDVLIVQAILQPCMNLLQQDSLVEKLGIVEQQLLKLSQQAAETDVPEELRKINTLGEQFLEWFAGTIHKLEGWALHKNN